MRHVGAILAAGALGALIAASGPSTFAKTAEQCQADYAANKDSIKASGRTEKAYMAACKAGPDAAAAAASSIEAAPIITRTKAECAAEYSAHMAAIRAAGQTKAAFDADCRAGTEKIPPAPKP